MPKSVAFNNDGSEVYVSDFLMQHLHVYTWDDETKKLVKKNEVKLTKGRMDNMKVIEGTDHVMGGNMESLMGNINWELERKTQTWENATTSDECLGGAEEYRRGEDGEMESRYQVVSSKINGWTGAAKVGPNVVCGSFVDKNFLVCPYDDTIAWTKMKEPSGAGGFFFFMVLVIVADICLFCVQWRKVN